MKKTMIVLIALLGSSAMLYAQNTPPSPPPPLKLQVRSHPIPPKYPDLVITSFEVLTPNAQGVSTFKYTITNKGVAAATISGVMVNAYDASRVVLGGKDISQGTTATLNVGQSVSGSFTSTKFNPDPADEQNYDIELRVDEGKVAEVNECNNSKIFTYRVIH